MPTERAHRHTHFSFFYLFRVLNRQNWSKTKYISESQCNILNHHHNISYCRHTSKQHTHLFYVVFSVFKFSYPYPCHGHPHPFPPLIFPSQIISHTFLNLVSYFLCAAASLSISLLFSLSSQPWKQLQHYSRSVTVSQFQTLSSIVTSCHGHIKIV